MVIALPRDYQRVRHRCGTKVMWEAAWDNRKRCKLFSDNNLPKWRNWQTR